jgi:Holliday junction resolvase RusA-like endonuclease
MIPTKAAPWILEIPGYLPLSLNRLMRSRKLRMSEPKRAAEHFGIARLVFNVPKATGKRRVSLVFTVAKGKPKPDPDNLVKVVLDGLVKAGVLVDDSDEWCELGGIKLQTGQHPKTMAIVEDLA